MPKKRSSGGRSKGGKGRSGTVQCSLCGAQVPKDKAKRQTKYTSLVEPRLLKELRASGTQIARSSRSETRTIGRPSPGERGEGEGTTSPHSLHP